MILAPVGDAFSFNDAAVFAGGRRRSAHAAATILSAARVVVAASQSTSGAAECSQEYRDPTPPNLAHRPTLSRRLFGKFHQPTPRGPRRRSRYAHIFGALSRKERNRRGAFCHKYWPSRTTVTFCHKPLRLHLLTDCQSLLWLSCWQFARPVFLCAESLQFQRVEISVARGSRRDTPP